MREEGKSKEIEDRQRAAPSVTDVEEKEEERENSSNRAHVIALLNLLKSAE